MKRQWLLFSQVVTVLVAIWFVVMTLKPEWIHQRSSVATSGVTLIEAAPNASGAPMPGSYSPAAKLALFDGFIRDTEKHFGTVK